MSPIRRSREIEFPPVPRGHAQRPPRRGGPGRLVALAVILALLVSGGIVLFRRLQSDDDVSLVVLGLAGSGGEPERLVGAAIAGPGALQATTDENGAASLALTIPAEVEVSAPGYETGTFRITDVPDGGPIGLQLEPVVLRGRVTDPDGAGIAAVLVRSGEHEATTDDSGAFTLVAPLPGPISATRSAWEGAEEEWDGSRRDFEIVLEPFVVRGIRVTGVAAGSPTDFARLLDMIEGTVVNTLVFDTKDEDGAVHYASQVPAAQESGVARDTYDVETVLAAARERGLYTITRIVTFQDPKWAPANPEHAARNTATGGAWVNDRGLAWADPTDREAWEYPLALAVEACRLGFDEVQFDYVRFPSDGDVSVLGYDEDVDEDGRVATISAFLSEARDRLHAEGCAVSADIFAIVLSFPNDQGIGQRLEELSRSVDVLSPMIYPSHYSAGWLGFDNPNDHPAEVVRQALDAGMPRLDGAMFRPWLQAFYYDAGQIAEEIAEAERYDLGWMLWNAASQFEADWFPTE